MKMSSTLCKKNFLVLDPRKVNKTSGALELLGERFGFESLSHL